MTKKIYEIAAEIVQAQASVGKMTPEEIEVILLKTFGMLQKMRSAEEEGTLLLQGDGPRMCKVRADLWKRSAPRIRSRRTKSSALSVESR